MARLSVDHILRTDAESITAPGWPFPDLLFVNKLIVLGTWHCGVETLWIEGSSMSLFFLSRMRCRRFGWNCEAVSLRESRDFKPEVFLIQYVHYRVTSTSSTKRMLNARLMLTSRLTLLLPASRCLELLVLLVLCS